MITVQMLRAFVTVYTTVLLLYICELLPFACCVICEYEGILSPEPYKNIYEVFSNSGVQLVILLITSIAGISYKMFRDNMEEVFICTICFFVLAFKKLENKLNFISTYQLKDFAIFSILVFVGVFILRIIANITFEPDGQDLTKPTGVAQMVGEKNKGEENIVNL